jgi:DNA repair protein RadC
MGLIRNKRNGYRSTSTILSETEILSAAEDILRRRFEREASLRSPGDTRAFLRMRLAGLLHEEFHAVWLDNRHNVIAVERLFNGTIDGASVHLRETVRAALQHNAAAVIIAHNHPSGIAEPSLADRTITMELKRALQLVGVRVLDHIVIGAGAPVSFAEEGLL